MPMLVTVALLSLAGFALVRLVRKLVPAAWLSRRPWGCDVCLACWASLACVAGGKAAGLALAIGDRHLAIGYALAWFAVAAGTLLLLEIAGTLAPREGPPPNQLGGA